MNVTPIRTTWSMYAFRLAGMEKLYIDVPKTMWSAAISSAISSSEIRSAFFISGECRSAGG